jgi:hypothetical protein
VSGGAIRRGNNDRLAAPSFRTSSPGNWQTRIVRSECGAAIDEELADTAGRRIAAYMGESGAVTGLLRRNIVVHTNAVQ